MPVKFRCSQCGQLLGISRRKIGTVVACPRCHIPLTVPEKGSSRRSRRREAENVFEQSDFEKLLEIHRPTGPAPTATGNSQTKRSADWEIPIPREPDQPRDLARPASPNHVPIEPLHRPTVLEPKPSERLEPRPATSTEPAPIPDLPVPPAPRFETRLPDPPPLAGPPKARTVSLGLFVLGLLLSALVAFAGGFLVGRNLHSFTEPVAEKVSAKATAPVAKADPPRVEPQEKVAAKEPEPSLPELPGSVVTAQAGGNKPDAGSSVVLLPTKILFAPKIQGNGLLPKATSEERELSVEQLTRAGGAFTQVSENGTFSIRAPKPGAYWVLVISKEARRGPSQPIFPDERDILSRYFTSVPGLLADQQYLLVSRDIEFERSTPLRQTFHK